MEWGAIHFFSQHAAAKLNIAEGMNLCNLPSAMATNSNTAAKLQAAHLGSK